ncbi:MAG: Crp/Fnr family transcriptional regulator [Thermodesulfobacteriota bacterium]
MPHKASTCAICRCRIRETALFSELSEKQLQPFKDAVAVSSHKKKEAVFTEGEECTGLHIICTGRVKLLRSSRRGRQQIIKILQPGDMLGMEIFYDGRCYVNTAVAMDDTDLCFIERDAFFRIVRKESGVSGKLVVALGRELKHAYDRIGDMGLMSAREKLAQLLSTLAGEYGIAHDGGIKLNLTLSRLEIAELLGITQETSIRLLKSFKKEEIIDIKRKEILIRAPEKLRQIGGGE